MKIRNGFVSNSSSSSFMVFNPPTITNMPELIEYLKEEPNAETRKDFDHMLALFQKQPQKLTKKEIIKLIARTLQDGNIPFFEKLFREKFDEEYDASIINYIICLYDCETNEEIEEIKNMFYDPHIIAFMQYMWMFGPTHLINICNDQISLKTEEDNKKASMMWARQDKSIFKIYKILADNVYEKLKDEGLIDSLLVFEVADDSYPTIESGAYFTHVDNISRISNH